MYSDIVYVDRIVFLQEHCVYMGYNIGFSLNNCNKS